jgi:hypothetical protein
MGRDKSSEHCKLFTIPAFTKDLLLQLACLEIPEVWISNPFMATNCPDGVFFFLVVLCNLSSQVLG